MTIVFMATLFLSASNYTILRGNTEVGTVLYPLFYPYVAHIILLVQSSQAPKAVQAYKSDFCLLNFANLCLTVFFQISIV